MNLFEYVDDSIDILDNDQYDEIDDIDPFDDPTPDYEDDLDTLYNESLGLDTDHDFLLMHNNSDYDEHMECEEVSDEDIATNESNQPNEGNAISFKGYGGCRVCGCKKFEGLGDICNNCYHHYNKHY